MFILLLILIELVTKKTVINLFTNQVSIMECINEFDIKDSVCLNNIKRYFNNVGKYNHDDIMKIIIKNRALFELISKSETNKCLHFFHSEYISYLSFILVFISCLVDYFIDSILDYYYKDSLLDYMNNIDIYATFPRVLNIIFYDDNSYLKSNGIYNKNSFTLPSKAIITDNIIILLNYLENNNYDGHKDMLVDNSDHLHNLAIKLQVIIMEINELILNIKKKSIRCIIKLIRNIFLICFLASIIYIYITYN
jgi:hypothetical protein